MNIARVSLEPAFILHSRPYRDTSLLVELLTSQYGRLSAIARGARNSSSKSYGLFAPFLPLLVSFSGKNDLQTLQKIEANGLSYDLKGDILLSGFYLNELLIRLLGRHNPQPNIYQTYQQTLQALADDKKPEITLRLFEKSLLVELGYGLQLDRTIDNEQVIPEEKYFFEFGIGLKKAKECGLNNFTGKSLLAIHTGKLSTQEEILDAKRLLRPVFAVLLGNKSLKTRELFV